MNKKIISYESEIEKLKEQSRKIVETNNKKIKVLQKKIEAEKEKEQRQYEQNVIDIVRKFYGEFSEENLKRFEKLMSTQSDVSDTEDDA